MSAGVEQKDGQLAALQHEKDKHPWVPMGFLAENDAFVCEICEGRPEDHDTEAEIVLVLEHERHDMDLAVAQVAALVQALQAIEDRGWLGMMEEATGDPLTPEINDDPAWAERIRFMLRDEGQAEAKALLQERDRWRDMALSSTHSLCVERLAAGEKLSSSIQSRFGCRPDALDSRRCSVCDALAEWERLR